LWKLAYPCNSLAYTGNTVSIPFGNPVCKILVYQQDVTSGCISDSTLFKVDSLKLEQIDDKTVKVCEGRIYNLSAPYQDNVFYNWVIEPVNAASVQGDKNSSTVTVLINHLDVPVPSINAILTRTYCGKSVTDTIVLHTKTVGIPVLSYPETVCRNELVYFSATGSGGTYIWLFDDNTSLNGNPVSKKFSTAGQHTFELKYAPANGCDTVTVQGSIFVQELPEATLSFEFELPQNLTLLNFWNEPDFSIYHTYNKPDIIGNFSINIDLLREWNAMGLDICFLPKFLSGNIHVL